MRFDYIERFVSWAFRKIGYQIGCHPGYFIIIPILISALLITGVQQMKYVTDPEYLFSPTNGISRNEQKIFQQLFPMNLSSNFDVGRITRLPPAARVIIEAKGNNSVLQDEIFKEILWVDGIIQNISVFSNEREWRYKDICAQKKGVCFSNDILKYSSMLGDIRSGKTPLKYPLKIDERQFQVLFTAAFLGGVQTDENSNVKTARTVNLMYFLADDTEGKAERAELWQIAFLDKMTKLNVENITLGVFTAMSIGQELDRSVREVAPFISITLVAVLMFSVIACTMMDWVKSKILLGVVGCLASGLAVLASFGFVMYCGMEFISINLGAGFLMLGIGMDDTFVLLAAWHRTNEKDSVPKRMSDCFAEAGVAITITSLTNIISFCIGITSSIAAVRVFCVYTAAAVTFTYLYQIMIFGGFMALCGHVEKRRLHALVCVPVMPRSLSKNQYLIYRLICTGGKNPNDPDNPEDNSEHLLMVFFRDGFARFLGLTPVKIGVVVFFGLYLALAAWGWTQINEGLEYNHLVSYNSYAVPYIRLETTYNRLYPLRIPVLINGTLDYADPAVQDKIEELFQKIENSRYVASSEFTESWLRIYLRFLKDDRMKNFIHGLNMTRKDDFIYGLRKIFFRFKFIANYFEQDVIFNEDKTEIVASRFVVQAFNISDSNAEKAFVNELREIVNQFPFQATVFNPLFLYYDQLILTRSISIQSITIAAVVMIIISLVFIPSTVCALWVAFSIISIEIGVIGYMSLWNVHLDPISMIGLIMCIGFSVDYSAHISYAYMSCKKEDPNERLRGALHSVGLPIIQGSISSIITALPLTFAPSYIFVVLLKTVVLVICFGALHSLLLLPVLLSVTDRLWRKLKRKDSNKKSTYSDFSSLEKKTDNDILYPVRPIHGIQLEHVLNHNGEDVKDLQQVRKLYTADSRENLYNRTKAPPGETYAPDSNNWKGHNTVQDRTYSREDLVGGGDYSDGQVQMRTENHFNPGFVSDIGDDNKGHSTQMTSQSEHARQ